MNYLIQNGELIKYFDDNTDVVIIPDGVTVIKQRAFYNTLISSVTFPDSLKKIEYGAFECCENLTDVLGGRNIEIIEEYAFEKTPWLEKKKKEECLVISNNILINGEKCCGDIVIPDGVNYIAESAFRKCQGITSVIIPNSVQRIGKRAFSGCLELKAVTLPDSITFIYEDTFESCEKLKKIIIPEGVTGIGSGAFYECTNLLEVSCPESLTIVNKNAFANTAWLKSELKKGMFVIANNILLNHFYSYIYKDKIEIPEGVCCIGEDVFSGCDEITSVTIPESLKRIEGSAFRGCCGITQLTIPEGVVFIGKNAFNYCSGISELIIPDSVKEIEIGAFTNCTGLKKITIGKNVTRIPEAAFSECNNLETVAGGENIEEIGECAFSNCVSLQNINIGRKVEKIGEYAFYNCKSLKVLNISENIKDIDAGAFKNTPWFESVRNNNTYEFIKNLSAEVYYPEKSPLQISDMENVIEENNKMSVHALLQQIEMTEDSKVLHRLIKNYEVSEKYGILYKVINNKCCELSTALTIFGIVDGYEYLFDKNMEAEDDEEKEWLIFVKELYNNIINGTYKEGKIFYKPMIMNSQLLLLKRTACDEDYIFLIEHGCES